MGLPFAAGIVGILGVSGDLLEFWASDGSCYS